MFAAASSSGGRAGALGDLESPSAVPADVAAENKTIVVSQQDHASHFPDDLASRSLEESNEEAPATTLAPLESLPASTIPQPNPVPAPFASITSLDNLHGIAPIAEALIKTLAAKARTGRLDELKTLQLLLQAVLL